MQNECGRDIINRSWENPNSKIAVTFCATGIYLQMEFDVKMFYITAAVHPSTYLNKVLLGSRQGELQLWNVMHSKLIYTFKGWGQAVTVLVQVSQSQFYDS